MIRRVLNLKYDHAKFKRGFARIPGNMAGEKFLIFDLTMSLESPQKVITKTKI
jgi:hypothetical protein